MKLNFKILMICFLLLGIMLSSPSCNGDEQYQAAGTAVLQANNLLMVKYPDGPPDNYQGEAYKNLLRENYQTLYERIQPYQATIKGKDNSFIVQIYDGDLLILTDWGCTDAIDCWSYNGECKPDTLNVQCDR